MEDRGLGKALPPADPSSSSRSPFVVQSSATRPRPAVGTSSSLSMTGADFSSGSVTRHTSAGNHPGPTSSASDGHPLANSAFLLGLKSAGYLEPLDTSRNKIKQRFNHFLEKQNFKANLYAFLEHTGVERLGESMVRFVGTEEPHSPYVSVFVTSAIETTEAVKIYAAADPASASPDVGRASTRWTLVTAEPDASCEWACTAKRFWSVRVRFEGPTHATSSASPAATATVTATRPRGKRRDTFQREVDLDAHEWKKRGDDDDDDDELRAKADDAVARLELNTARNSARPRDSVAIAIDTQNTAPIADDDYGHHHDNNNREPRTPVTPTVLEAAKQLGTSIVASLPPSMQQLPTAMQHRIKQWLDRPGPAAHGNDDGQYEEYDSEEDRRRREKRRRRRERRRREEEAERDEPGAFVKEEDKDEERRARKAERRRRRADEQGYDF
ncbi:hypothetical protein JCM11491_004683 [Sporobolomyces phaffii]